MAIFVLVLFMLVLVLIALIVSINHGDHYAPQAYYRRKRGGASVAYGYESLAPRYRERGPEETGELGDGDLERIGSERLRSRPSRSPHMRSR